MKERQPSTRPDCQSQLPQEPANELGQQVGPERRANGFPQASRETHQ
ncbi:hypothetical protein JAO77_06715 [Hymenobacter sp. BT559]|nr:hypothetical protein [Hymenobacter sp. BT559]